MSSDELMRASLIKKLQDPEWQAQKEREYERIVGSDRLIPLILDARLPAYPDLLDFLPGPPLPRFEEPTTIEELWLDRWQRSSGAFTITRLPDDLISIDFPSGSRRVYRPWKTADGFYSWVIQGCDVFGRGSEVQMAEERLEFEQDALFEMHRAALAEFDELTNDY